jgi:hypothetical protein
MAKRYKPQGDGNGNGNGNGCYFGWDILKEMKENHAEFWAADENKKLQIVQIDERARNIFMICRQTGKITWPLSFEKLEDLHIKIHEGNLALTTYEIEKCIPTWGNYVTGLLRFLGCKYMGDL